MGLVGVGLVDFFFFSLLWVVVVVVCVAIMVRGVNVRPNPRTRHEPDTVFSG